MALTAKPKKPEEAKLDSDEFTARTDFLVKGRRFEKRKTYTRADLGRENIATLIHARRIYLADSETKAIEAAEAKKEAQQAGADKPKTSKPKAAAPAA